MGVKNEDYRSKLLKDPVYALEAAKGELIMDVTESICGILERKNLERQALAKKMNKSKGFISQILNGSRNMTLGTLTEIARVLGYVPKITFEETDRQRIRIDSIEINMEDNATVYDWQTKVA